MECEPCSFKSCCIEPWISSITELQNGNKKGGKNASSSQPVLPQLFSKTASGQPIPHSLPAQRRSKYRWAGHRTLASGFAHIRRSRSRASASFPSLGARGAAAKVSGPAGASAALAAPCPRTPTQCPLLQTARWVGTPCHLVPTHLGWTWLRQLQPNQEGEEKPAGQGVGRIGSRDAHTGSRASPAPGGRLPQDTCSAALRAARRAGGICRARRS